MAIEVIMGKTGMKVILSMAIKITMRKGMEVILVMAIKVTMRMTMKVMGTTMEVIKEMTMGTSMKSMSRGMDRDVARGSIGSTVFLLILVLVNLIGGGSRLAVDSCAIATMGFVDGGSDSRGIAVFDALVAVLIGGSQSQKGQESDESLKKLEAMKKFI